VVHLNYPRPGDTTQAGNPAKNSHGQFRFRKHSSGKVGFVNMMNKPQDDTLVPGANPDPASPNHATIKSTTHARAGVTFGTMRWVLAISLLAVVVVFGALWAVTAQH
jgi:hypothetical protein